MDLPISKSEDIYWKLIDNRVILLHIDEAVMLQLDDTGTKIWHMIDGEKSGQEIVEYFIEGFEVERRKAEKDIRKFLKKLLKDETIVFKKRKE
jgi:hypothetical protein